MAIGYEDDLEELTEEERQRRAQPVSPIGSKPITGGGVATQPIGQPIMPQKTQPIDYPSINKMQPTAPDIQQDIPDMTSPQQQTPPVSSVGTPIAPRPAGNRLSAMAAEGSTPKQPSTMNKILNGIGGATTIGRAIEQGAGIGKFGHDAEFERNKEYADAEQGQIKAGEESTQAAATAAKTGAEATEATQRGNALEAAQDDVTMTIGNQTYTVPRKDAEKLIGTTLQQSGATQREGMKETAAQLLQSGKPISLDQLAAQAMQEGDQATVAKVQQFKASIAAAGKQEPGSYVPVNDATGGIVGWANPKSREWVPASGIAHGAVTQAVGGGEALPPKPTAQTLNMGQMAQTVTAQIPRVQAEVKALADKLGPAAGRWNELYANKLGADDPEFVGLDTDLDLLSSAIVRTHFGARGGQGYQQSLKKMFTEAQTADDLISRISHADIWIQGYAQMAGGKGQVQPGGGAGTGAPNTAPVALERGPDGKLRPKQGK